MEQTNYRDLNNKLQEDITEEIRRLAAVNSYDQGDGYGQYLKFRQQYYGYIGVSEDGLLIDKKGKLSQLFDQSTESLISIVEMARDPELPLLLETFVPGKIYSFKQIEIAVNRGRDILENDGREEIGHSVLRVYNSEGSAAVFVLVNASDNYWNYLCTYNELAEPKFLTYDKSGD